MSDAVDRAFHALKLEYLAAMPYRLDELRSDVRVYRAGDRDREASLKVRLHRLAGSGGSYGFMQLSSIAREAELWLDGNRGPSEADELAQIVERIAQAAEEAAAALKQ